MSRPAPLRWLRAALLLCGLHLRRLARSRRLLLCALVAAAPVGAAVLVTVISEVEGPPPAVELGWLLIVQGCVPLVALVLASAVVAEEVEDGTLAYLVTRPVPRSAILVGRWLAVLLVALALLNASALATFVLLDRAAVGGLEQRLPPGMGLELARTCLLGGTVYTAVFAALGALVRRPVLVGVAYAFAVEGFLANLPGKSQTLTVTYHLKSWLSARGPEIAYRLRHLGQGEELAPGDEALRTLAAVVAVALVAGCAALARGQHARPG